MNTLVERLRDWSDGRTYTHMLTEEAADEIERMQDMMAIVDSAIGVDGRRIAELEAELKEALGQLAETTDTAFELIEARNEITEQRHMIHALAETAAKGAKRIAAIAVIVGCEDWPALEQMGIKTTNVSTNLLLELSDAVEAAMPEPGE